MKQGIDGLTDTTRWERSCLDPLTILGPQRLRSEGWQSRGHGLPASLDERNQVGDHFPILAGVSRVRAQREDPRISEVFCFVGFAAIPR
jgi:hypothetical protein